MTDPGVLLALGLAVGAQRRARGLRRGLALLRGHAGEGDVLELLTAQRAELTVLRERLTANEALLRRTRDDVASSLRHVAVVRYDAFADVGGRLSFSAAVVDDAGDGLVLSSIAGRSGARTYLKGLSRGRADAELSIEERRAVRAARTDAADADRRPQEPAVAAGEDDA